MSGHPKKFRLMKGNYETMRNTLLLKTSKNVIYTRNSCHLKIARGKCKSCILVVDVYDIFSIFDDAKVLQS